MMECNANRNCYWTLTGTGEVGAYDAEAGLDDAEAGLDDAEAGSEGRCSSWVFDSPCNGALDEKTCAASPNCFWGLVCMGDLPVCSTYTDEASCLHAQGCTWAQEPTN
ncbi:MAG: hypothetical protein ACREJ3_08955 [Polyangiaceae bacterium]